MRQDETKTLNTCRAVLDGTAQRHKIKAQNSALKMLLRSSSSVLLLAVLWLSLTAASATTTLTVNLAATEAGTNGTLSVPPVCNVTFRVPDGYNPIQGCTLMNNSCTVDTADEESVTMTFTNDDSDVISFSIDFDPYMTVSCSEYIPHIQLSNLRETVFRCSPLYACGSDDPGNVTVVWRKFFDFDTLENFTASPEEELSQYDNYILWDTDGSSYYPPKNISDQTENTVIIIQEDGQLLNVSSSSSDSSPGSEALGYYIPTIVLSNNNQTKGPYTIVYLDPEIEGRSDSKGEGIKIIQGYDEGRNYDKIHCIFRSFPPVMVTWDAPRKSSFELRNDTGNTNENFVDLDLTYFSRLFFEEIQYDDAGKYRCTGDNGVSSTRPTYTTTLRVRNRLRPLWPALGIVGSFVITTLFIFGGALVDKCRGKQTTYDDEGSFVRNYSVVSHIGEDSSNNNNLGTRRGHLAAKRLSSTTQELLPNAS